MGEIATSEARALFSELINRALYNKERIVLTRRGKAVVAIVPIEDYEELEAHERLEDEIDAEEVRRVWQEQGDEPLADWETVKADLGLGEEAPEPGGGGSGRADPPRRRKRNAGTVSARPPSAAARKAKK